MSNKKISDKDIANEDVNFIEEMIKEYRAFGDLYNPDFEDAEKIYKALENILAEREQDKKRIQELKEENAILRKANNITKNIAKEVKIKDITQVMNKSFEEYMKDYIPKQKVKDKIEELKIERDKTYKKFVESNRNDKNLHVQGIYLDAQIIILQEFLKGE